MMMYLQQKKNLKFFDFERGVGDQKGEKMEEEAKYAKGSWWWWGMETKQGMKKIAVLMKGWNAVLARVVAEIKKVWLRKQSDFLIMWMG